MAAGGWLIVNGEASSVDVNLRATLKVHGDAFGADREGTKPRGGEKSSAGVYRGGQGHCEEV